MEFVRLSGEDRESTSRVIAKIGTRATRSFSNPSDPIAGSSKYQQLARELAYQWTATISDTDITELYPNSPDKHQKPVDLLTKKAGGVRTGFRVTGAVIEMTLEAYKKATKIEDQSVDELVEMQKNPKTIDRTILMLARKPNDINVRIEEALCLNDGATELAVKYGDIPFQITRSKEGVKSFKPDMIRVIQTCGVEVVSAPERPDEQCPAQRFLPILWNTMVDICATDPRFYQADLGVQI